MTMKEILDLMATARKSNLALNELPQDAKTEDRAAAMKKAVDDDKAFVKAVEDYEEKELENRAQSQFKDLERRAKLGRYLQACIQETKLDGAELELNQELKLEERSVIPTVMLDTLDDDLETRQEAASAVNDSAVGRNQMTILDRVFRRTDAAYMGVRMPSVPRGLPTYPVLASDNAGIMAAPGQAVEAAAATFTGITVEPKRATARYLLRVEDMARLVGMEDSLRRDINMLMGVLMDRQVVAGDGQGTNLAGVFTHAAIDDIPEAKTLARISDFDMAFAGAIDGLYAYDRSMVRMLSGIETARFVASQRVQPDNTATFADALGQSGNMLRASSLVPGITAADQADGGLQFGYRFVSNGLEHVAPVWEGIEIIRDMYSGAASGEVALTAVMLFGYAMIRNNGIRANRFQVGPRD